MADDNGGGVTKPISDTVKALAGTPMLLAVVILNVLILGLTAYLVKGRAELAQAERSEIIQLLHNCLQGKTANPITFGDWSK